MSLQTDQKDASCTAISKETTDFKNYIEKCRTNYDKTISNTFLNETIDKYIDMFKKYDAQFVNLLYSGDSLNSMTGNIQNIDNQKTSLQRRKETLKNELHHYRNIADSADKTFLEDVYKGTPEKELAPSLQDIALLLFWFGWLVMSITLIAVRTGSPGGGWKAGLFAFVIILLVTLCVFALLRKVA